MNFRKLYSVAFLALLFVGLATTVAWAQSITLSGTVVADIDNSPIPGANIVVKGTSTGTISDLDGHFSISLERGQRIVVSFMGHISQEVLIDGAQTDLQIRLATDTQMLADVVVIGYGTVKKSDLTGAVSQVGKDDLSKVVNVDPLQKMQGRVAGVSITTPTGEPGKGATVRIRGVGTINNSNPIYVVDGFITGDISNIPPEDIQSMEILKDASATAIYGSRGANGVVLITTRSGKVGKMEIDFGASYGVQQVASFLPMANAWQYATLLKEAYANDGSTLPAADIEVLDFVIQNQYKGTDWQREIFRTAPVQNYTASIHGGSEKNQYLFTANFFQQEGLVKNSGMDKLFLHFNDRYKLSSQVEFTTDFTYTNYIKNNHNADAYNGAIPIALRIDPITMAWDANTNNYGDRYMSGVVSPNPAQVIDESLYNINRGDRFVGNTSLNVRDVFVPGLSFTTRFVGDFNFNKSSSYLPEYFISQLLRRDQSQYSEWRGTGFNYQWSSFANYQFETPDHRLSAMAGAELQEFNHNDMSTTVYDVPADPNLHYPGMATNKEDFVIGGGAYRSRLASFFGRANYSLKNRYMLTATMRADGSSKFIGDNVWGYFPSVAAGWNVKEEAFMSQVDFIDGLKLRASWGQVGNEGSVGANAFLSTVNRAKYNYTFGSTGTVATGSIPVVLSNPEIKWETTEQSNVGIDLSFLKSRLSFTAEYFIRTTKDMILRVPIPVYAGAGRPASNVGSMRNSGFEFTLGWNDQLGDFRYGADLNLSFIQNEILDLGGSNPIYDGGFEKIGGTTRTIEGYEIAHFYGLKTDGVFNTAEELAAYVNADGKAIQPSARPGDLKFVDSNGDGKIDGDDRQYLGSAMPDFMGGFRLSLGYKGFDLSAFLNFSYGNEVIHGMKRFHMASDAFGNWREEKMTRWTAENTASNEPRVTVLDPNGNSTTFSDRLVEDGSYLKMKNLQLGYTYQVPAVAADKYKLKNVRVYVSADNLFTLTKYTGWDPEVAGIGGLSSGVDYANYPIARVFNLGVNLKF